MTADSTPDWRLLGYISAGNNTTDNSRLNKPQDKNLDWDLETGTNGTMPWLLMELVNNYVS